MIRSSISSRRSAIAPIVSAAAALAVLVSVSCAGGSPSPDTSADAKTLTKLDEDWSTTAATRDAKRVASFYADDAIGYPPNEPVAVGKAAVEKVWAAYFADPTYNLSWKTTHAEVAGAIGYTSGTYEDSYKGPDGKTVTGKGKYVCLWKKQSDGTWKAFRDIWNTDSK